MDLELIYPCFDAPLLATESYHSSMGGWTGGMARPLTQENDGADTGPDLAIRCGDLATGNELSTAVLLSLFTDRRANEDDPIPDGTDPRGWWADALDDRRIGSRLWLLERARNLPDVLRRAEDYATEALAWLIEDGIVRSMSVAATVVGGCFGVLFLDVRLCKPDGKSLAWRYRYAWNLRQLRSCQTLT